MLFRSVSVMAGFLEMGMGALTREVHPGAARCSRNLVHRLVNFMGSVRLGEGTGKGPSLRQSSALDAGKSVDPEPRPEPFHQRELYRALMMRAVSIMERITQVQDAATDSR